MGLESAMICDSIGVLQFNPFVFYRTFYVLPKLIILPSLFMDESVHDANAGNVTGFSDLTDQFLDLIEYRNGMNIRRIHWKKFFAIGTPYIKRYQTMARKSVHIYFDMRPPQTDEPRETEDVTLEIALAIANYYLRKDTPITIHGGGRVLTESSFLDSSFDSFYNSTVTMKFDSSFSPLREIRSNGSFSDDGAGAIVILHHPDYKILDLYSKTKPVLIINRCRASISQNAEYEIYIKSLQNAGIVFRSINSSDEISRSLEC